MSDEIKNENENELSESELDEVAGGTLNFSAPSNQVLIGLLLPAVQVSAGDVNGDGKTIQGNLNVQK